MGNPAGKSGYNYVLRPKAKDYGIDKILAQVGDKEGVEFSGMGLGTIKIKYHIKPEEVYEALGLPKEKVQICHGSQALDKL